MAAGFVVHHNPNNGRYRYASDPTDAVASAKALLADGASTWVAGNCRNMLQPRSLLLFKFGGAHLKQRAGIYAAAHVLDAPRKKATGKWTFKYKPDPRLTRYLVRSPIVGKELDRLVPRSFGASIQALKQPGYEVLRTHFGYWSSSAVPLREDGITRGLAVKRVFADKILAGTKTWEIRGRATEKRGSIALIESGSGLIVGICDVVGVEGPLSLEQLRRNARRAGFLADELDYDTTYAWVLKNARRLREPVPYRHPRGAVIWVRLKPAVVRRLQKVTSLA